MTSGDDLVLELTLMDNCMDFALLSVSALHGDCIRRGEGEREEAGVIEVSVGDGATAKVEENGDGVTVKVDTVHAA